jgi:hypothetical protein
MIRLLLVSVLAILSFTLAGAPRAAAQSPDRAELLVKIESLRDQLQNKERTFLAPSAADLAAYSEFLKQPDTGMARLMPREKYRTSLLIREGGAYYSFTKLTNEYTNGSDVGLERGKLFGGGFAGANFGFITALGDVPIEGVNEESPGVPWLSAFITPSAEPDAREQQRRTGAGFEVDGFTYRSFLPAATNTTYALRSVSYDASDVLVVFRITRQDTDGSLILAWKVLRKFGIPKLAR